MDGDGPGQVGAGGLSQSESANEGWRSLEIGSFGQLRGP
jgi:hypothetical protein